MPRGSCIISSGIQRGTKGIMEWRYLRGLYIMRILYYNHCLHSLVRRGGSNTSKYFHDWLREMKGYRG